MKRSIVLLVLSLLCHPVFQSNLSPDRVKSTLTLKRLEEHLDRQNYKLQTLKTQLESVFMRHAALRKKINKMNDETRLTCFELNYVPKFCIMDKDRYIVLQNFASAIGMQYKDSDIVEIKYFYKKLNNDLMSEHDYLNYIIRAKTLAIKEAWLDQFSVHVKKSGYKDTYNFPGVSKKFEYTNNLEEYMKSEYYVKKYSLVNVTMRDHISPFKASLMAVVRGKIKPRRHYFRVKINRSNIIVDRLMPMRKTVRHIIHDFSDIAEFNSL